MELVIKVIVVIVVLLVVRDFLAWLFRWGNGETFVDTFENAEHNRKINKKWKEDGRPIVEKTIGWRPDPWNKNDGFRDNLDGSYSKLIRGGTKEYREQFEKDVERSRK